MYKWIEGNVPKEKDKFHWLTIKGTSINVTHPVPCVYLEKEECWLDFQGTRLSIHTVVAHYPIILPKSYNTIGTGVGFYIKTTYGQTECIYGFGLQFANWVGRGYNTKEKAIAATKRLIKLDKEEKCEREKYEVVNGQGEVVWTAPTK